MGVKGLKMPLRYGRPRRNSRTEEMEVISQIVLDE